MKFDGNQAVRQKFTLPYKRQLFYDHLPQNLTKLTFLNGDISH